MPYDSESDTPMISRGVEVELKPQVNILHIVGVGGFVCTLFISAAAVMQMPFYRAQHVLRPSLRALNDLPCESLPARIIDYNNQQLGPDAPPASFKYWDTMRFLNGIKAFNPDCPDPLGPELDADSSIVESADRFRLLLGDGAQHLHDVDLPFATGLEWPLSVFRAINRPLSYDLILKALADEAEVPWWITTNVKGVLTLAAMVQQPLRSLSRENRSITVADAGSGSGFFVAMLALMTPPDATAVGIEYDREVAEHSQDFFRSKALLDGDFVGGAERATGVAEKIRIYEGDAMSMNLRKLQDCRARGLWRCDDGDMPVPEAAFDLLNVGFGLRRPFPRALTDSVRPGGYLLAPTCYAEDSDNPGYCHESMTLYKKLINGSLLNATVVQDNVVVPLVDGIFVEVSQ